MTLLENFDTLAQAPGGVARLRELILTLAVQGKLVRQDPADEPASALLERIRGEKARLVKEGKIRKEKPPAAISDEEKPFELPGGWNLVSFPELCLIGGGATPSKAKPMYWEGDLPWVSPKDMKVDFIADAQDHVSKLALEETRLPLVPKNSLLIVVRGMILAHSFPVSVTQVEVAINQDMKSLTPLAPALTPYLALACKGFKQDILELVERSSHGTCKLESDKLFAFRFGLPPLAEQSRIVARVEELMALCDALEKKGRLAAVQHERLAGALFDALANSTSAEEAADHWQRLTAHFDLLLDRPATVDRLEQAILQLAVRGRLVPQNPADEPASALLQKIRSEKDRLIATGQLKRDKPQQPIGDEEKPFALPEGWEWARFSVVAEIASNLVSPHKHQHMPQVAPDCIEKATGRLTESRTVHQAGVTSPNHLFRPGQILYSKIRPSLSKAVVVDFEGLCSADMYPIDSFINTSFLHRYILSQPFLAQVQVAENRVKMPKLNQEALNSFVVPVPPLAEQSRIVARVAELRALCAQLLDRLAATAQTQSRLAEALLEQAVA